MSDYTLCVALTWQIAAEEAAEAKQEFIEPEQLFIGLCKLVSFSHPDDIRRLGLPDSEAANVRAEINMLQGLFGQFAIDPNLRRELRQRKSGGLFGLKLFERPREGRIIHRSPQTRQVFTRATELAREANSSMTTVAHLLAALVDHPNLAVPAWLRRKAIDVIALKQAALAVSLPQLKESTSAPALARVPPPTVPGLKPPPDASGSRVYTTHSIMLAQTTPPDEALVLAQRRLQIFYALGQEFGAGVPLERFLHVAVTQLSAAMPQAQRGVILIPDARNELLLHEHWPPETPSFTPALAQQASEERHPVVWTAPVADEPANLPQAAVYIPLLWGDEVLGVLGVENHTDRGAFLPEDLEFLTAAANQIALFVKQQNTQQAVKWQELMRHALLYQFSPQIANLLVERGHLRLQKETVRPVAILLANLRGFAALSSSMGADGVVQALDEIFSIFVPILSAYDGSLEKNSGESFLVVFEPAGPSDTTQGERALRAAWDMQRTVRRLEDEWQRRGWLACDLGIGLHAGEVLAQVESRVGNTFYPTLDELIEQTSRYSEAAERGEIIISQTVFARLFATVEITPRIIQAKGTMVHPDIKGYLIRRVKDPTPTA